MSGYLSMLGWAFLPGLATSWIQTLYYGITIRAGDPKPAPGSARFNTHRRVIHILVIATYLLYTIYEADYDQRREPSYYADLGVSFTSHDREIKSRFRRLAALHHPDKVGSDAPDSAVFFMHLKQASDTLQDTAKRFAYERFGPEIARWSKCITVKDFVSRGVISGILPHYGVAAASIYILGLFGYMEFGKYYRWLILLTLCTFELHTVTRPDFPTFVTGINAILTRVTTHHPYLPFQIISLARKLTITVYIALAQIGPLLAVHFGGDQKAAAENEEKAVQQNLDRLEAFVKQLDGDAVRLLDMELAPYKGDAEATSNLQGKMREWLVQNTIRADPMVRDALGTSLKRRRVDAPSGAKGNR
ncbi:hypothetical protein G7Z17_g8977 [Cylindrodendrum hubeiense]|uniref:J domain-containing protein n=1 Tax=Cylindrodendrum hubeiense TaxID=595255 RepID=A0A9P5H5Z1_9HYPO|nr:hypothetical protein G7Z17_g8977 [Cylindrodendrum hubeiense]